MPVVVVRLFVRQLWWVEPTEDGTGCVGRMLFEDGGHCFFALAELLDIA